jgi:hypothetical protein
VFALARTLLLADAVSHDAMAQALLLAARDGGSLVRALIATRALDGRRLGQHLERGDTPYMHQVAPVVSLVESLPAGLCDRLMALPVRLDPMTGTIDIAVVDARDPHPVREMAYWLNAPVRMVQTSLGAMEGALQRLSAKPDRGMRSLAAPIVQPPPDDGAWETPRHAPDLLSTETAGDEDPVAIIELGPPAVERPALRDSDRPAPPTVRGPFMAEAGAFAEDSAGSTVRGPYRGLEPAPAETGESDPPGAHGIRTAGDRDGILESLVDGARLVARRIGIFALRRDGLVGWTCSPELTDRSTFRALRWSPSARSILRAALPTRGVHLVNIPDDAVHAELAGIVGPPSPHEVALASVFVDGKGIALVLADELDDALVAIERLQQLTRVAGEALELLLRDRRDRRDESH